MSQRVWVNPHQPQTLYIAQILLYFQGGLDLLLMVVGGAGLFRPFGANLLSTAYILLMTLGKLFAAYGIANRRRWGYKLGVAAAAAPLAVRVMWLPSLGPRVLFVEPIGLIFEIALFALLTHPTSRLFQRQWPQRR